MSNFSRPVRGNGRVIAGVCAAIANRFGWSVGLVRLLAVLSFLLPGPQLLIYVVMWIVIPSEKRGSARPA